MKRKKALSGIVITVLLVLIAVAAVGLIASFVIPMVKDELETGKSCFDLREYFKLVDSPFSCYNPANTSLKIERSNEEINIKGFVASISSGGESKRFDVIPIANSGGKIKVRGFGDENNFTLELPAPGEAKTYFFLNINEGKGVNLAPISASGKVCESSYYTIPKCN